MKKTKDLSKKLLAIVLSTAMLTAMAGCGSSSSTSQSTSGTTSTGTSSEAGVSDGALYKQAGNAVSINTIYAVVHYLIANKLLP